MRMRRRWEPSGRGRRGTPPRAGSQALHGDHRERAAGDFPGVSHQHLPGSSLLSFYNVIVLFGTAGDIPGVSHLHLPGFLFYLFCFSSFLDALTTLNKTL